MSTDEEKYKKLRDQLHSLPRIKAKNDFEARLFARIKELEHNTGITHKVQKPEKEYSFIEWLSGIFRPSLVPALGLSVVLLAAIIVYFTYYSKLASDQETKVSADNNSRQKGEFVIYVKKDGERVMDETNRDITSADLNSSSSSTDYRSPSDVSSDGKLFTQPKIDDGIDREVHDKLDRISPEQELKMEKESQPDTDMDKVKSKSEEPVMKKGYYKEEKKDAPSNYDRTKSDDTGEQYQGGKNEGNINAQEDVKQTTDEETQKDTNRLSERKKATKKDSLKVKEKKTEENDTIEKK
jgi:hypothetical protein